MTILWDKVKEVLFSVLPIVFIVLVLHFTVAPLPPALLLAFLVGSVLVVLGLTIFLFGIDQGLEPIGQYAGRSITHTNSYPIVMTASLILGFFISFAEPDLHILAKQVDAVTNGVFNRWILVIAVSIGIGVMMTVGMLRILHNIRVRYVFAGAYGLILLLSLFSSKDFMAIAFDSSGATTGAITVPFMLSLAYGISSMKKDSKIGEADSFGVIGISSTGAIIGVLVVGLFFAPGKLSGELPETVAENMPLWQAYLAQIPLLAKEAFLSLLPILATYLLLQLGAIKHNKRTILDILRGVGLTFFGLVIFLSGVNSGFMHVGAELGKRLAGTNPLPALLVAFFLGITTVLAEPAVHVLTNQVEDVTGGSVKRSLVCLFLSLAVGAAIFLSALRILVPQISLWMLLLPGFGLAVLLSFFVPDLFVGMAIDAGGVASGPMTATFSLAFVQGIAAHTPTADVVADGFGMIAVVAMVPIVAIELLGVLYQAKLNTSKAHEIAQTKHDALRDASTERAIDQTKSNAQTVHANAQTVHANAKGEK